MTIQDFLDMDFSNFSRMTFDQRKEIVDDMAKKANRRLDNLARAGVPSAALEHRINTDIDIMYFTSEGKNANQLANEAKNLKRFLSSKSSTVTGAKNIVVDMMSRVMNVPKYTIPRNELGFIAPRMRTFWEGYNKVLEANPAMITTKDNNISGQFTSGQVQQKVYEVFKQNLNMDSDELWARVQELLDDEYVPPESPGENPFTFTRHD